MTEKRKIDLVCKQMVTEFGSAIAKFGLELKCEEDWGGQGTIFANIHQPNKFGALPSGPSGDTEIRKIIPSSYEGFTISIYYSKTMPTVDEIRERIRNGC